MIGRRGLMLGAAAPLAACGFRPLYLPEGGKAGPVSTELAAIYVPPIGERAGQLLRQALQRRLEGSGTGVAKKYELVSFFGVAGEGIAIQRDSSTTRLRLVGTAIWSLRDLNLAHTVKLAGNTRVLDGVNISDQQLFAADLEQDSATRRLAETVADLMVLKLAIYFRNPTKPATAPAPLSDPSSIPTAVLPPVLD